MINYRFRLTTVSRIDGKPTTKAFRSYLAARNEFDQIFMSDETQQKFHYVGLFANDQLLGWFDSKDFYITSDAQAFTFHP